MHSSRSMTDGGSIAESGGTITKLLPTKINTKIDHVSSTDDGDFCEFVSPLRKKFKKETTSRLETENRCLTHESTPAKKSRGSSGDEPPSFAKRLKDKMKNNSKMEYNLEESDRFSLDENSGRRGNAVDTNISACLIQKSPSLCMSPEVTGSDNKDFYGLPSNVKSLFWVHRSISELYEWQKNCLEMERTSSGLNLIYSLPTSGGKTLVAEILMLKQVICKQKNALFVLPYVAIVQEKIKSLAPFGVDLNFLVEEYAGSKGKLPPMQHRKKSIYVGTIEKAASLVNSLIENRRIGDLGLVVVDELHMIGEGGGRGSTLEAMLTKIMFTSPSTQLVGMSATLSNIEDLKIFLKAQLYNDDFRPVELKEFVKVSNRIYIVRTTSEDKLQYSGVVSFEAMYSEAMLKLDSDHLLGLVMEVIPDDSCLIFCSTKKNCENVAQLLCSIMPESVKNVKIKERKGLLRSLRVGEGLACPILEKTVTYGVAYHHGGLTNEERKLIEEAFLERTICVIACTSTLAAGVNLPAKRVIVRSPYVGCEVMTCTQYKQMVGRAGRAGFHSSGESFLIANVNDRDKILPLLGGGNAACHSSLLSEGSRGLSSFILSCIGLKVVKSTTELTELLKRTMCYIRLHRVNGSDMVVEANKCLKELMDDCYVVQGPSSEDGTAELDVTKLGKAVFKGSIEPKLGRKLFTDLQKHLSCLVLSSHLHLLYLVTPYEPLGYINIQWMTYLNEIFTLSKEEEQLLKILGISETYLQRKVSGMSLRSVSAATEGIISRFYLTLMLNTLLKKQSVWEVADKFQTSRGFIQNLLSHTATFASCVLNFCTELESLWPYQDLLPNFMKKLSYYRSTELIPLLEIPGVKIGRARLMYKAGYHTVQQVAQTSVEQLAQEVDLMPKRVARQIIASAQMIVKEKLEDIIQEVHTLIPMPMFDSQFNTNDSLHLGDLEEITHLSQLK